MLSVQEKSRLEWYCRRGMLELDLILQAFLKNGVNQLNLIELRHFERLLNCTDPELYSWLMGYEQTLDKELNAIVSLIRNNTNT